MFATIMCEEIRTGFDWVARYGGEEFILCLPQSDLQAAKQVAERIRRRLEQSYITADEHRFSITASFGVCTVSPDMIMDAQALIHYADHNLYQAKDGGRNCVVGSTADDNKCPRQQSNVLPFKATGSN
jgi:diguanylate cyclase (GGDEF)-like protein